MTVMSRSDALAFLKERWLDKPKDVYKILAEDSPTFGMMTKDENAGGKYTHIPILQTGAQGRSATYATSVANSTGSKTVGFDVTYGSNYQQIQIDGNLIRDMRNAPENALITPIDLETKAGLKSLKDDLRLSLFGNHGGARGTIGSVSTTRITLANPEDAINFAINMEICASDTDGTSGSLRDSAKHATVTAVDPDNGYIDTDTNWDTQISGITAGDYLFVDGDFGIKPYGMADWIPTSAPGATSYFGVDRSVNPTLLGGVRFNGSKYTIEEAFIRAGGRMSLLGVSGRLAVLNPIKWADFAVSLGSTLGARLTQLKDTTAQVGYSAIKITTGKGEINVVSDPGCPKRYGMILDLETWKILSCGPIIQFADEDGTKVRRGTADNWVIDVLFRGNYACSMPGGNCRIDFGA